jgi:ferritin-like metal-binding protein YciE
MKNEARFEDVFQEQLADLYDAETQIVQALPKMIAQSSSEALAGALQLHLDESKEQIVRLEALFEQMGEQPGGRKSEGIEGLLREAENSLSKLKKSPVLDIVIIAAAQKVEHYEIAGYGTICAIAEMLGQQEALVALRQTLQEEKAADEALAEVAEGILTGDEIDDVDTGGEEVSRQAGS